MVFRWLDITPTSRVIARCTQDIQAGAWRSFSFPVIVDVLKQILRAVDDDVTSELNFLGEFTSPFSRHPVVTHSHSPKHLCSNRQARCGRDIHAHIPTTCALSRRSWRFLGQRLYPLSTVYQTRDVYRESSRSRRVWRCYGGSQYVLSHWYYGQLVHPAV